MQSKTEKTLISIDEMAIFCRRKGFVYPSSEIYGSLSGFFDYGPLGVELKNNIKSLWWERFVHQRDDMEVSVTDMTGYRIDHVL